MRFPMLRTLPTLVLFLVTGGVPLAAFGETADLTWQLEPHAPLAALDLSHLADQFVLDDGTSEGAFGVGGTNARQFLWFNQFDLPPSFLDLREVQVLFPSGANMAVGNAVDLVVFHDDDGDPTNGATWLVTYPETIQSVDGATFSTYAISPPLNLPSGGQLLVGVVPRFVVEGTTSQTSPAAIDTSSSAGRSWLAVWNGDPPSPPTLPPDLLIDTIDVFTTGNWMIRAAGGASPAHVVPTASEMGLGALIALIAIAGVAFTRRA